MTRQRLGRLAGIALTAIVLGACGRLPAPTQATPGVVTIGFTDELAGGGSGPGRGAMNSALLAIRQANARDAVAGFRLRLAAEHAATPQQGAAVAAGFARDRTLVGVLGAVSSGVSRATSPVLADRDIAQLSYSNTHPALTLGPYPIQAPRRMWTNFFRLTANDLLQGELAAGHARERARARTVVTVNDQKPYGQVLVAAFEREFRERGGTIVSSMLIGEDGPAGVGAVAVEIALQDPDLVYYAGEYDEGASLLAELRGAGYTRPLMAGDTLHREDLLRAGADGVLATSVGRPLERLPSARRFIGDYARAGFAEPASTYGGQAYDAAAILIQALAEVMPEAGSTERARPRIIQAIGGIRRFQGVTGEHSFDEHGDSTNEALTVYEVVARRWRPVATAGDA